MLEGNHLRCENGHAREPELVKTLATICEMASSIGPQDPDEGSVSLIFSLCYKTLRARGRGPFWRNLSTIQSLMSAPVGFGSVSR
jgi:hypothetical protein